MSSALIPTALTAYVQGIGQNVSSNAVGMFILFASVLALCLYVAIQLYNLFVKTDLQTVTLVKDVRDITALVNKQSGSLFQLNVDSGGSIVSLPSLHNGNEYSLSYWLYIDDFVNTSNPKLITFAANSASIADSSMIMYMDPSYVKMNLLLRTSSASGVSTNLNSIHTSTACNFYRAAVPYIPVSRWMNVTVVVDNFYIQLFIDGELRHVIDTNESFTNGTTACRTNITNTIGRNFYAGSPSGGEHVQGFISKMKFFNYALTLDHAKMLYKTGPLHQSILSKMGIPMYGLRNPFYRVDDVTDSTDADV